MLVDGVWEAKLEPFDPGSSPSNSSTEGVGACVDEAAQAMVMTFVVSLRTLKYFSIATLAVTSPLQASIPQFSIESKWNKWQGANPSESHVHPMRKVIAWSRFPHFWAEYTVVEVRRSRIIEVENIESRWNESFPSPHLVFIVFRGRRLWEVKGRNPRATPRFLCSKERQVRGNRFDSAAKLVFSRWWQRHLCPNMPYSSLQDIPVSFFYNSCDTSRMII